MIKPFLNRYAIDDVAFNEHLEQIELINDTDDNSPKPNKYNYISGVRGPTCCTYLDIDPSVHSPKIVKISNQNALLSLMSNDDFEGIKN